MRTRSAMRGEIGCGLLATGSLVPGMGVGSVVGWELIPRLGVCAGAALALLAAGAGALLLLAALDAWRRLEEHAVLRQVMRYPAGERWLVLPSDYHRRHGDDLDSLRSACERKGVGLLTVDRRENVVVQWEANPEARMDMLAMYKRGEELRDALEHTAPGTAVSLEE